MSGDDDVLRVPLVHLRHAAAQDVLAAASEGVGAGDGAAVNAPHVDVGPSAGHYVSLLSHTHTRILGSIYGEFVCRCGYVYVCVGVRVPVCVCV